jgi:hypothetical protein
MSILSETKKINEKKKKKRITKMIPWFHARSDRKEKKLLQASGQRRNAN